MGNELDTFLKNSEKRKLIDTLEEALLKYDKVIVVMVQDYEDGSGFSSKIMTLGIESVYEGVGILEIGKDHVKEFVDDEIVEDETEGDEK